MGVSKDFGIAKKRIMKKTRVTAESFSEFEFVVGRFCQKIKVQSTSDRPPLEHSTSSGKAKTRQQHKLILMTSLGCSKAIQAGASSMG